MNILKHDTLTIERQKHYILATFHHDLTMESMLQLKPLMLRAMMRLDRALIIDLAAVNFLDSSAVGILALFFRHAQQQNLPMSIIRVKDQPEAVLAMVGLSDYVPLYADLPQAMAALKGAA